MKLKKCIEKIKNCEVVSFDIFDTLVNRCIGNPKEIYLLIEQELRLKYGNKFEGFANKRIWAEKMAVATSKYGEVTLEEIYNFLELENKSEVTCLEKNIEIEISTVNDEMFDLYQECRHMKKRIFLCSDMYLDKETIKAILDKNGYVEYEKLYLSSERRKRKSDGSLYRELKQELKIDSKKIIHIGDNIKSDYLQPIRYGLNAYHYRKPKRYMRNTLSPYNILYGDMPKEYQEKYYWQQVGKYSLGNSLYGFTEWLISEMRGKNFEKIFFLSRDGWIMQKALERVDVSRWSDKSIYLYVSRRALIVPILHLYAGYETRCRFLYWPKYFNIEYFLENFGLDYATYRHQVMHFITDDRKTYKRAGLYTDKELLAVYGELEKAIEENSKHEYELLVQYLKRNGFKGRVAIIDIGWFGNLQNALEVINKKANLGADIEGYYIGIRKNCHYFEQQKMNGYLYFREERLESQMNEMRMSRVIEAFYSYVEGSVKCYEEKEGNIVPILKSNELNKDQCEILNIVQESALKRVQFLSRVKSLKIMNISPNAYFYGFYRIGIKPTLYDAWNLGKFVENNQLRGTWYYIFHLNHLKRDTQDMYWKIGQLKRVLKIKINYFRLQNLLDRFKS